MQNGSVDLSIQDDYGFAYVPSGNFLHAMQVLRLEQSTTRFNSAVHFFRGEIYGLRVEVVATAMLIQGNHRYYSLDEEQTTHYKVKGYLPESIHIKGKGRDKLAWNIYRQVTATIEEALGEDYSSPAVHKSAPVAVPQHHNGNTINLGKSLFPKGKRIVPRWETLSPVMVRRFMEWYPKSETRWADEYSVSVRVVLGSRPMTHEFKFEERAHAVECEQWWNELGYRAFIKVL